MTELHKLLKWLSNEISKSEDKRYRHRLLKERQERRTEVIKELKSFVLEAHEDARHRLRRLAGISLDPCSDSSEDDPSEGYPQRLHIQTLKGYFGEIFAGLIAENLSPFGKDWDVPVFLFRHHLPAFHRLEKLRQGEEAKKDFGRFGDDCLAFQRDELRQIIRILYCEAKCILRNHKDKIEEAHAKVSEASIVDIPQVIEVLLERGDPISLQWADSLRNIWLDDANQEYERLDLVSYICPPVRGSEETRIPRDKPHEKYTGGRQLEAVETHLHDIEDLVREIYGKKGTENDRTD